MCSGLPFQRCHPHRHPGELRLAAESSRFEVCDSTYALCTTARCTPISGEMNTVFCKCDVKTGLSIGQNTLPQRGRKPRGDADHLALLPGQDLCRLHQRLALGLVFRHAVHRRQEGCEQGHLPCQVVSGEGSYLMITESYNASTLHQWPLFFGDGRGVQADHGLPQNQQAEAVRTQGPERGEVTGLI
jgi:hypothetical protein